MALIKELLALSEGKNDTYEYELILKDSKRKVIASKKITGNFAEDILEDELGEFMENYPDAVETQVKKKKITKEGVVSLSEEEDDDYEDEPKSFDEVVDEFLDKKGIHRFEGPRGLRNLDILAKGLGYRGGSSEFFEDNSGALEAVIEWIKQFGDRVPEWKESLESVLGESLSEAKNHMGETEYSSFASWKAAVKKKHPDFWIDGDKDIAQAMVGEQPFKRGKTKSVGEWDGSVGTVF